MSRPVTFLVPKHETTQALQLQSLRLEHAVAALRAVGDLAGALQAAKGREFCGMDELSANSLSGLMNTLACAVEAPLRELDVCIGQLERGQP